MPFLVGIAVFALPIVSLGTFRQLLGNLFVLEPWNIFWTMMATVMLAWAILVTIRVVLLNGEERFGIKQWMTVDKISVWALLLIEFLALPMLVATVFSNGQAGDTQAVLVRLGLGLGGVAAAHVVGYFGLLAAVLFSPRYHLPAGQRFPVPFPIMRAWLDRAYKRELLSQGTRKSLGDWGRGLPAPVKAGYFDPHTGMLYPGHWLSILLLGCTIALYLVTRWFGKQVNVPAIAYAVLLLLLLNWILGMAAFFLDRFRVPLLLCLAVLIWIGNQTPQSDHYYSLRPASKWAAPRPAAVLTVPSRVAADPFHPHGRVVVVATAGGGIQAAAWTAKVLTGLERELKHARPENPVRFADSIALISSVSGGAVGTLFFVNGYKVGPGGGFSVPEEKMEEIVAGAESPSLDDIAWALAHADFWRIFFPYAKFKGDRLIDRGKALEDNWRKRAKVDANLGDWREGVEDGQRPAVIFNATLVESGEPLLLATTAVPGTQTLGLNRRTLSDLFPKNDISLVTSVRLAATFPYVTPAAIALEDGPQYHIVDGGYYDNYGVYSMLEWLRAGLGSLPRDRTPDLLIIQIRSFPSDGAPAGTEKGWFYQVEAPVKALMAVRTTGQLVRDRDALTHFAEQQEAKGLPVRLATFEFQGDDAPLSWKMNEAQTKAIQEQWRQRIEGPNNQDWLQVRCFFVPEGKDCASFTGRRRKGAW